MDKIKVMVVDDSRVSQAMLEGILSKTDFEVVAVASTVAEAVEKYKDTHPAAVTMDMNLPDGTGIECSRKLLEIDPKAKIVMISAMRDASLMAQGRAAGIHSFLQKPVKESALIDTLMILCQDRIGTASFLRESYVKTFAKALKRCLENLLGVDSEISIDQDTSHYLSVRGIAVIIGLTGFPMGRAVVHMDTETMREFAVLMLRRKGGDDLPDEDINDSVEEAANIIIGRGVSKVNDLFRDREMRLTPPGTISGSGIRIANPRLTSFEITAKTKIGNICANIGFAEGE